MKRFLVFTWSFYYPRGGWNDFQESYDTAAEALAHLPSIDDTSEGGQVIDSETWTEVSRF